MSAVGEQTPTLVLGEDAVRWGIEKLQSRRIHPFFLAYLHLRKWSRETGSTRDIQPHWNDELAPHMEVAGAPPTKPYYRPFAATRVHNPASYWLNSNIPGSFAPSSVRGVPQRVVELADGGGFHLRENHAALARQYLLYDEPVNAVAFAVYWYRDYGFHVLRMEDAVGPDDLAGVLASDFRFTDDDDHWDALFTVSDWPMQAFYWFEPLGGGQWPDNLDHVGESA